MTPRECSDLPSITCEIGIGREKNANVNLVYREWVSGVSGLSDFSVHTERLKRQIQCCKNHQNPNSDTVLLGDANLNALKWEDDNFKRKEMAKQIREYLAGASRFQIIDEKTRIG